MAKARVPSKREEAVGEVEFFMSLQEDFIRESQALHADLKLALVKFKKGGSYDLVLNLLNQYDGCLEGQGTDLDDTALKLQKLRPLPKKVKAKRKTPGR